MLLAVALATWSVQDPSLSHATNAPVRNLLGVCGAIACRSVDAAARHRRRRAGAAGRDLGLAAHHPSSALSRTAAAGGLGRWRVLLAASFASCLPRTPAWPLPAGLGGVFGDALLRSFGAARRRRRAGNDAAS